MVVLKFYYFSKISLIKALLFDNYFLLFLNIISEFFSKMLPAIFSELRDGSKYIIMFATIKYVLKCQSGTMRMPSKRKGSQKSFK